ncbi:LLM class F420-dependent oxidoreductase [Mycobacterium sp. E1747]|nr:LLM class F420-dependent oxidoreductase [Mycobacterium sp. E1747]
MRIGVALAYWGLGFTKDDQATLAVAAEQLGFDSLWVAEGYGSDAVSVLAWLAAQTKRIKLGSSIMQIPGRPPTMTAMSAATLDTLSDGRFSLGLGLSGPQVSEGWYGVRYGSPLTRTREYVDVLRMTLARHRVEYHGDTIDLPLPDGPGKPLKLTIATVQSRIPILLAAIGPRNVALAGEIADGWMPTFFSPEHVDALRAPLIEGVRSAGRDPTSVKVCPQVPFRIDEDVDRARDAMRPILSLYVGGMGALEKNFYAKLMAQYGFANEARRIQELFLSGRKSEAARALTPEMIDSTCLCGPVGRVRERLNAYAGAGVDTLLLLPTASAAEDLDHQLRLLASAGRDHLGFE